MRPHTLDVYRDKYNSIALDRDQQGVLTVIIHEPGHPEKALEYGSHPLDWDHPHVEWSHCFYDIARDFENEIVILTAAGDKFISEEQIEDPSPSEGAMKMPFAGGASLVGKVAPRHPSLWDFTQHNGTFLQMNLLSIEVPIIAAVNGPALTHAELLVQSDVVICAESAQFQDQAHFESGLYAPGDGVSLVWPQLIGMNRGRYFLLTGQKIGAQEALDLGIVSEVVPKERLMERARELAAEILKRPRLVRRYARQAMVYEMKQRMLNHIGYGLAMEGLSVAGREVE